MSEVTVLIDAAFGGGQGGISTDLVDVVWESSEISLQSEIQSRLESRWAEYLADAQAHGKTLFDGPISRLISAQRQGQRIVLRLGPATYKQFVVTCMRDRAWFTAHAQRAMTRAFGNSALLTQGNRALLGIRSARVSAYAGRAHLIGGVLDQLGSHELPATVEGIVKHLRMELREEVGILDEDLQPAETWPRLLCVVQDEFLGQPEAIWQWETRTDLETLSRRFNPAEHGGAMLLPRGASDDAQWRQLTPLARHAWQLWSQGR